MIGYLKGKVVFSDENKIIIDAGGVGYEVECSAAAYMRLQRDGEGEIFVYTNLREDGIYLYGFDTLEEKKLFLLLITVGGVGPKMGVSILSQMDIDSIISAIASGNQKVLSTIKGLGKKTAERIVLELQDKVEIFGVSPLSPVAVKKTVKDSEEVLDAITALTGLGFTRSESEKAARAAVDAGKTTVQEIIGYAIKNIK